MVEGSLSVVYLCSISCYRGVANILVIAPRLPFTRESDGPFLGDSLSVLSVPCAFRTTVHHGLCLGRRVASAGSELIKQLNKTPLTQL